MSEYIERSALLKYWLGRDGRRFPLHDCDNFPTAVHLADVQQSIRNAPAADVAQVVRCKDCCYWNRKYTTVGECEKLADRDQEGGAQFDCDMDNDDFCSYGKRKENT